MALADFDLKDTLLPETDEEPPTVQGVEQILADRRSHRNLLRTQIREDLELYRQSYEIDMPPNFHQVNTPTTTTVVDRLADRIGSAQIIAHMEPRRSGVEEKKRVESLEKAAIALTWLARKRNKYNVIRGMAHHGASRGGFVLKIQVEPENWKAQPVKENESDVSYKRRLASWKYEAIASFPILMGVRPMEAIYPDPETDGDHDIIEHYQRRVGDIKKNYPNWPAWTSLFGEGRRFRDEQGRFARYTDDVIVDYTEIWTRNWRGVIVGGKWVPIGSQTEEAAGPVRNVFGRPPYFLRYAGFGDPEGAPEERCRSILRPGRTTFIALTRLLSIIDTVAENEAYGTTLLKTGDSGNKNFSIAPGSKNEMDDPASVRPYRPDGLNPMVLQALGLMQGVAESGSVPSEAIGQQPSFRRGTAGMSGVGASIITGQASMILSPLVDAIKDCLSDAISFILYIVDAVVPRELPIWGQVGEKQFVQVTLDSDLIDGHYGPVYVSLALKDPEEDYAREEAGVRALGAGLQLPFVLERFFRIENAESMTNSILSRQIAFHPEMVTKFFVPRLIAALEAQTGSGGPGGPGGPGSPPNGQVPGEIPQGMSPEQQASMTGPEMPFGGDLRALAAAGVAPDGSMGGRQMFTTPRGPE